MRATYSGVNGAATLLETGNHALVEIGFAARKGLRVGKRLYFGKSKNLGERCRLGHRLTGEKRKNAATGDAQAR
ncbi:hypothetical protein X946_3790 [Burkholderia sp. ABCPW 111]|nr:hypothetical protein X946_3790 [Burkholderia sp. ABCPW 111]